MIVVISHPGDLHATRVVDRLRSWGREVFVLDIADLYRHDVLLDIAFGAVREARAHGAAPIERLVRKRAALLFRQRSVIPGMIDRIKGLLMPGEAAGATT